MMNCLPDSTVQFGPKDLQLDSAGEHRGLSVAIPCNAISGSGKVPPLLCADQEARQHTLYQAIALGAFQHFACHVGTLCLPGRGQSREAVVELRDMRSGGGWGRDQDAAGVQPSRREFLELAGAGLHA